MSKNVRPVQFGRKNPFIIQNKSKIMTHYHYPFSNGTNTKLPIDMAETVFEVLKKGRNTPINVKTCAGVKMRRKAEKPLS